MFRPLISFVSGWVAAQLFLCALLAADIGAMHSLIIASDAPWLPIAMLSLSLGALVGAASVGTAFALGRNERAGTGAPALLLSPVPVRVRRDR